MTRERGSFYIDKAGLTPGGDATTSDGHKIIVTYEVDHIELDGDLHTLDTQIHLGSFGTEVDDATVTWISTDPATDVDVFRFTGPVVVLVGNWGSVKGRRGGRGIACEGAGDNLVEATITWVPVPD